MSSNSSESRFEKQGYWWLPTAGETQIPGALRFGHDVESELSLLGCTQSEVDALNSFGSDRGAYRPSIILGRTSDGKEYTLVNCLRSGFTMSGYITESYSPAIVIEGKHFRTEADIHFRSMSLRLSHLSQWFARTGRNLRHTLEGENLRGIDLEYRPVAPTTVRFDNGELTIGVDWGAKFARFGGEFSLSENAAITITLDVPAPMYEFLEEVNPSVESLITLGVGCPLRIQGMSAKAATDCVGIESDELKSVPSVQLYWEKSKIYNEDKELFNHDMVFTHLDVEHSFEDLLTQWVRAYRTIKPVMQLFFSRVMAADVISETSFLNAVQAAEAYHRHRRDGAVAPKSAFQARRDRVVASAPEEDREWLEQSLMFSNEKRLLTRLSELLIERRDLLRLNPDAIERIAKRTKDIRNHYTHYTNKKKSEFATGMEFYILGTLFRWVTAACLLEEAGMTRERVHSLLDKSEPFRYFRSCILHDEFVSFLTVTSVNNPELLPDKKEKEGESDA